MLFISAGEQLLKIKENDSILKHDSLWPYGLNFFVHNDSYAELVEFRKSCVRHKWPPSTDITSLESYDLDKLLSVEIPAACANKQKSPTTEEAKDVSDGKASKTKAAASGKPQKTNTAKADTTDNGESPTADNSPIERTSSESSVVSASDTAIPTTPKPPAARTNVKSPRNAAPPESRPKSGLSKMRPHSGSGRGRGDGDRRKIPTPSPGRKWLSKPQEERLQLYITKDIFRTKIMTIGLVLFGSLQKGHCMLALNVEREIYLFIIHIYWLLIRLLLPPAFTF